MPWFLLKPTEKADKTLDQKSADGIAGKKTRNELDTWLQKNWIKPVITLRHGDYDNNGTNANDRQRGAENHHEGDYVIDSQKNLQKVDVYTGFALDGWFHNYMLEAVKHFQEAAQKGNFIVKGKPTDIGEKLIGHQKGILCPKTQEYLQKS